MQTIQEIQAAILAEAEEFYPTWKKLSEEMDAKDLTPEREQRILLELDEIEEELPELVIDAWLAR